MGCQRVRLSDWLSLSLQHVWQHNLLKQLLRLQLTECRGQPVFIAAGRIVASGLRQTGLGPVRSEANWPRTSLCLSLTFRVWLTALRNLWTPCDSGAWTSFCLCISSVGFTQGSVRFSLLDLGPLQSSMNLTLMEYLGKADPTVAF